ncbi:hypothetical protein BG000_000189, partial [Podila horticola]
TTAGFGDTASYGGRFCTSSLKDLFHCTKYKYQCNNPLPDLCNPDGLGIMVGFLIALEAIVTMSEVMVVVKSENATGAQDLEPVAYISPPKAKVPTDCRE